MLNALPVTRKNMRNASMRPRLADLIEWIFGCSHRRTTFPITARGDESKVDGRAPARATYVVCLECGRQIAYDWTTTRLGSCRGPAQETPKDRG